MPLDAGTVVSGFRIERALAKGALGTVYEATQLSLGRTVALRLLEAGSFDDPDFAASFSRQQRLSASVHHPGIVPTYEAGEWEEGRFVATRFVRGAALADLLGERALPASRLIAIAARLERAVRAIHDAGLVHGGISAHNVLVDAGGNPYLSDLGLGRHGTVQADREALAALLSQVEREGAPTTERVRGPLVLAGAAALALIVAGVLLFTGDEDDADGPETAEPPPVAEDSSPIGSDLAAGPIESLGCSEEPGANTPACTLSQATVEGQEQRVGQSGVIRGWAVRGAEGELTLQVIRRDDDRPFVRGFSQLERVADPGPHGFPANIRVESGDRLGVLLGPGAVIGSRSVSERTSALLWGGALAPTPQPQGHVRVDRELLLRVDIEPGAQPDVPRQLNGEEARSARAGERLDELSISLPQGGVARVELVRVEDMLVFDSLRDGERVARIEVPDAHPDGRLVDLEPYTYCGDPVRGFCLRWLNEGETAPLTHSYTLTRDGGAFQLIG